MPKMYQLTGKETGCYKKGMSWENDEQKEYRISNKEFRMKKVETP
jgi:hypothetical protein